YFALPTNFEAVLELDVFVPLSGEARTLYVWARFEDVYGNVGPWLPDTNGEEVSYPGNVVLGYVSTPGVQFVQSSGGSWNASQTDVVFTWLRNGVEVATRTVRVSRSDAALTASLQDETGETTDHTVTGSGTSA